MFALYWNATSAHELCVYNSCAIVYVPVALIDNYQNTLIGFPLHSTLPLFINYASNSQQLLWLAASRPDHVHITTLSLALLWAMGEINFIHVGHPTQV